MTRKRTKESGQILIVFLLVLVVGLAVVLSVASRSITDIRTTTTSDESNRAYFAAEAGIEEALKRIQTNPSFSKANLDFTQVNQTKAKVQATSLKVTGTTAFEFPDRVEKDDVVQISLLNNFNDITSGSPALPTGALMVYWGDNSLDYLVYEKPAIEVTVVYYDGSNFGLRKFTFDPNLNRKLSNQFCDTSAGSITVTTSLHPSGVTYSFYTRVEFMQDPAYTSPGPCPISLSGVGSNPPVMARIKLLYNDVPQLVAVGLPAGAGWDLPVQGTTIESTGTTDSGVTRKLQVFQQYPSLPAIFDYVLFSGTDLTK